MCGRKVIHATSKCLYLRDLHLDLPIKWIKYFLNISSQAVFTTTWAFLLLWRTKSSLFPFKFVLSQLSFVKKLSHWVISLRKIPGASASINNTTKRNNWQSLDFWVETSLKIQSWAESWLLARKEKRIVIMKSRQETMKRWGGQHNTRVRGKPIT